MHTVRRVLIRSHIPRQRRWILNTSNSFSQKNQFESFTPEMIEKQIIDRIELIAPDLINHQFTKLVPTLIDDGIKKNIDELNKELGLIDVGLIDDSIKKNMDELIKALVLIEDGLKKNNIGLNKVVGISDIYSKHELIRDISCYASVCIICYVAMWH